MKNVIRNAVANTKAGQFMVRKCAENEAWANGVAIVGILLVIGVCLL